MEGLSQPDIRILVADDKAGTRDAYRAALRTTADDRRPDGLVERRAGAPGAGARAEPFEVVTCGGAAEAVDAVHTAVKEGRPFAVAFLDRHLSSGPDGVWAATRIRRLDRRIDIVIATSYAEIDPRQFEGQVPQAGGIFYLRKPFHPHEVRQLASALGRRRQAEDQVRRLARFDSVTGLPNRASFKERVGRAIELARPQGRPLAVLSFDLDDFRRINDTLGRAAGDQVLNEVAKLLATNLRAGDALARSEDDPRLARLAGDEFTVLLSEINRPADAQVVAQRLLEAIARPLPLEGQEVSITASIGIAVCPDHGQDAETLLRHADLALGCAKRAGKNGCRLFAESMQAAALARLTMENELRRALTRGELSLHYQPQVRLPSGAVSGVEALVRWDSATLGSVPPGDFIPVAETTGLIIPIGEWVLRAACEQLKAWERLGIAPGRVSVNVSQRQLADEGFPALVGRVLRETELPGRCLELEITESVLLSEGKALLGVLKQLKELGVQLAVDDFGTGYFRLTSLKQFPIDRLKIDRSFIGGVFEDPQNRAITTAVIAMAERMNLTVTAEGVETDEQLFFLTGRRCDEVQGYFMGRPVPAGQVEEILRRSTAAGPQAGTAPEAAPALAAEPEAEAEPQAAPAEEAEARSDDPATEGEAATGPTPETEPEPAQR